MRMISERVAENMTLGSISAILRLPSEFGFSESDVGIYICVLQSSDMDTVHSIDVFLAYEPPSVGCSLMNSATFYFVIRLLGAECTSWRNYPSGEIASMFIDEVLNVIVTECRGCAITSSNIVVINGPNCSAQNPGATIFKARLSTVATILTEDIFCALTSWHQNKPTLFLREIRYSVDKGCTLRLMSPNEECVATVIPNTGSSAFSGALFAIFAAVVVLLLVIIDGFFVLLYYYVKYKRYVMKFALCLMSGSQYGARMDT